MLSTVLLHYILAFTGNEIIHQLTSTSNYKIKFVLKDWNDIEKYATYSSFSIAGESDFYRLSIKGYTGDAGKYHVSCKKFW